MAQNNPRSLWYGETKEFQNPFFHCVFNQQPVPSLEIRFFFEQGERHELLVDNKKEVFTLIIVFIARIECCYIKKKGKIKILTLEKLMFTFSLKVGFIAGNFLQGVPVIRTLRFHCQGLGLIPDWGNKILPSARGLGCRCGVFSEIVCRVISYQSPIWSPFFRKLMLILII